MSDMVYSLKLAAHMRQSAPESVQADCACTDMSGGAVLPLTQVGNSSRLLEAAPVQAA
jgi:hypothetical protein